MKRTVLVLIQILMIVACNVPPGGDADQRNTDREETDRNTRLQRFLARHANDGKHIIVVLDSVRASEKDLRDLAHALRWGKVRIRQDGVRIVAGEDTAVTKYGARAGDRVIIISTESILRKKPG